MASIFVHEVFTTTMQVQSVPTRYPKKVRFGGAGNASAGNLGRFVGGVDATFRKVGANRGREMIVEDLMGFGFLRTGMDLMRGYFYGNGTVNLPAAGERLFREASSIFTDNILSGIVAWLVGKGFDSNGKSFSNGFTDFPTLELFQKGIEDSDPNESPFLERLSQWIVKNKSDTSTLNADKLKDLLQKEASELKDILQQQIWNPKTLTAEQRTKQATNIAKKLGRDNFDVQLLNHGEEHPTFKLDNLLDDVRIFKTHMEKRLTKEAGKSGNWAALAKESIQNTLRVKNYKLLSIGLGMAATFAVPFLNVGLTKALYGLDYYPGEIGLRKPDNKQQDTTQSKSFFEKHFPYVIENLHKGNALPLLLTAVPLPFALGFFNTAAMRFIKPWKKNALRNMFDFCKDAPFTAQQQMASMFALLITSRLLCARSDNEFRERMVDSFAGWGLWILGTPLMKKAAAAYWDTKKDTKLQKVLPDGSKALRTRAEIEHLLKDGAKAVSNDTLMATRKAHILLGAGSTIMSMILLGIVEPWIGIHWTKANEERKAKANPSQATNSQPPLATWPPMNKPQPFKGNNFGYYRQAPITTPAATPGFGFAYPQPGFYSAQFGQFTQWPPQPQQPQAWGQPNR